jgi:hypothetical protein
MNLLSPMASNAKTKKQLGEMGIDGRILYLEPSRFLCPAASPGCLEVCLKSAGRMHMSNAVTARQRRTALYLSDREAFTAQLVNELDKLVASAVSKGLRPVARLNGTSDVDWSDIIKMFPMIQFYDYTKRPQLALAAKLIPNYDVTFSRSEVNDTIVKRLLDKEVRVAVVFDKVPDTYLSVPVVNGDSHDFRFLDKQGVVVGLKAKGKARKDDSGFVVRMLWERDGLQTSASKGLMSEAQEKQIAS